MMKERVNHADEINSELDSQELTINKATGEHQRMNTSIDTGRGLITQLQRRDFIDKVVVTMAFGVFLSVCAYIVYVRIRWLPFGILSSVI